MADVEYTGVDAARCMRIVDRLPHEKATAYASRVLATNILMLYMPPGSVINEPDVAARLGVSRTPVHEAVNLLVARNLVSIAPKRATYVSLIDMDVHGQGRYIRGAVEPLLLNELQGNLSSAQRLVLERNMDWQRKLVALTSPDPEEVILADDEFHKFMYVAAGKKLVWSSMRQILGQFDRMRYIGLLFGYDRLRTEEHERMLQILENGGAPISEIAKLVSSHLDGYQRFYDRLRTSYPEYFRTGQVSTQASEAGAEAEPETPAEAGA